MLSEHPSHRRHSSPKLTPNLPPVLLIIPQLHRLIPSKNDFGRQCLARFRPALPSVLNTCDALSPEFTLGDKLPPAGG